MHMCSSVILTELNKISKIVPYGHNVFETEDLEQHISHGLKFSD